MKHRIYVVGLSCPKCKEKIKNALLTIEGVKNVEYINDYILLNEDGNLDLQTVKNTIENLGTYWVEKMEEDLA